MARNSLLCADVPLRNYSLTFIPYENLFLTPLPNGESRHPQAEVICGASQNVYDVNKFWKFAEYSEKIEVKDFYLGHFPPQRGKVVEKKSCVIYGSKSATCPWLDNVNFQKSFPMCHVFVHF